MTSLRISNLTIRAKETVLVENVSTELKTGELVVLLGPNGAGKTSLIRGALGLIKPSSGTSQLNGTEVSSISPTERAQQVSYLPQIRPLAWPNRVRDVVALGRFSHGATIGRLSEQDQSAVDAAISACDLTHLQDRSADTLSGGELARMHCARAFAAWRRGWSAGGRAPASRAIAATASRENRARGWPALRVGMSSSRRVSARRIASRSGP